MCGNETHELSESCLRSVDDEGHEHQGKWKVFRVKGDNEERHLASRVVLSECIRVRERESGEECVIPKEDASKTLEQIVSTLQRIIPIQRMCRRSDDM